LKLKSPVKHYFTTEVTEGHGGKSRQGDSEKGRQGATATSKSKTVLTQRRFKTF
jgi:hypothetical protein